MRRFGRLAPASALATGRQAAAAGGAASGEPPNRTGQRGQQEAAASRLAATRATPAELRTIDTAAQLCGEGYRTGEVTLFDRGDDKFHLGIAAASHNPFLVASVREARRLQRQPSMIGLHRTVGGHAAEAIAEHDAIYRAIRDGDPQAAAEAAATHLDNTLEGYRREIQRRLFG